jgi:hypothetical protein
MLLELLAACRVGDLAAVDPTLERLLGRTPMSMRDILAASRPSGPHGFSGRETAAPTNLQARGRRFMIEPRPAPVQSVQIGGGSASDRL